MEMEITTWPNDLVVAHGVDTDGRLLDLWLHGRPATTQRAYRADAARFFRCVTKPLRDISLGDVQGFADSLDPDVLRPTSRHRILSAVKSLFAFGHRLGYLPFDVARPLRLATLRDELSERILTEVQVKRILALERHPRNRAILHLLYASGVRVSECCSLRLRDLQERGDGGQITVCGKGGKTHSVLLPASIWSILTSFSAHPSAKERSDNAPFFCSRKGGPLHPSQVLRIVKSAAKRAGIKQSVSPHWMRHAHASHALDRGAPIHLVQATLGHSSVSTTGRYLHARPCDSSGRYLAL
jgi:site-specific recombinase XerD